MRRIGAQVIVCQVSESNGEAGFAGDKIAKRAMAE
jgi:hypothetical protein